MKFCWVIGFYFLEGWFFFFYCFFILKSRLESKITRIIDFEKKTAVLDLGAIICILNPIYSELQKAVGSFSWRSRIKPTTMYSIDTILSNSDWRIRLFEFYIVNLHLCKDGWLKIDYQVTIHYTNSAGELRWEWSAKSANAMGLRLLE